MSFIYIHKKVFLKFSDILNSDIFQIVVYHRIDYDHLLLNVQWRGLAGGFNSNVLKMAKAKADDVLSSGGQLRVMAVGKKAVEFFEKRDYDLVWKYPQIAENIDTDTVIDIVEDIIAGFRNGDYDKVELVYTTFVSALTQEPCSLQILPVEDLDKLGGKKHPSTIYDPSPEEVLPCLSTSTIRSPCASLSFVSLSRSEPNCENDCNSLYCE